MPDQEWRTELTKVRARKRPTSLGKQIAGALVAFALSVQSAAGAGAIVGHVCLDGVRSQAFPAEQTIVADGVWIPYAYTIDPQGPAPRIAVFDRAIPTVGMLETCAEVVTRMDAAGSSPIIMGVISALELRLMAFNGANGNRVQIPAKGLEVTLSNVETGDRPIAGGTIDLKGSRLWISNPTAIFSSSSEIAGILEIEAWNRRISAAAIVLPGGLTYRADLEPVNSGNLTIRLDLAGGRAMLWEGALGGRPNLVAAADADLDTLKLQAATLTSTRVAISARAGAASIVFAELRGSSASAQVPGPKLGWAFTEPQLGIGELKGDSHQTETGFLLHHPSVRQVTVESVATALTSANGQHIIDGAAATSFRMLSRNQLTATSIWENPTSIPLARTFSAGSLDRFELNVDGLPTAPWFSGTLVTRKISTAGIEVATPIVISIERTQIHTELVIPIHVDLPASSGSVSFKNDQGNVLITGSLHGLNIDGRITIPLPDVAQSHFDIPPNNLQFGVGAAIAISPFIAGTKPNFAGATLDVKNVTALRVASTSLGIARITATAMALGQPVVQIGDNGTASPATLDLKSDGVVNLDYNLTRGGVAIVRARLRAQDVDFRLIGPSPTTIDLGGNLVTDPQITLEQILVEIDRIGPVIIERGELTRLRVLAPRVERRNGLKFSGNLSQPFTVTSFRAGRVVLNDELLLGGGEVTSVNLEMIDGKVDLGDGVTFENASLGFKVDTIRTVQFGENDIFEIENAILAVRGNFHVASPSIGINNATSSHIDLKVSGRENSLNGVGRLYIGAFTGHADSNLPIHFACENSNTLNVPIEYNFAFGGVTADVRMSSGKLSGHAALDPIAVIMHTKGEAACNTKPEKWVVAPAAHGWTNGICTQVWPPKIWACKWEWSTPEISFGYTIKLAVRFLNYNLTLTQPHLYLQEGGKLDVCNVGAAVLVSGPSIGGYSPQISTPLPGADNIVNGIIAANFEAAQSVVATAVSSTVGWLVSAGITSVGNALCMGRP
jgi:hypothetical protein